ncbi:hypothetical protein B0H16DRAFT_1894247 [Mycena metata]|uniref:Uncharacterized protein n=1 Tax=Mycena metata TaxID=1033252 RepID=A0AAD7HUH8_9AGAR|nr:hypothetical protein B0H16DRAFT_1894247 [Mycena metata]
MSLLRGLLKSSANGLNGPNGGPEGAKPLTSKRNLKKYASSVKSSGGASMRSLAESVSSFYSTITGSGPRVPKRRRADFSRLGAPAEWFADEPPPLKEMPGTAAPSEIPPFHMAHSTIMPPTTAGAEPWLGLVLYSNAPQTSTMPMYHNGAKVTGEVRMVIDKPTNLSSVDVWLVLKSDTVVDILKPPMLTFLVNVWNRKKGDPRAATGGSPPFKGKFPAGTFIFPFEFPALPADTIVKHPDDEKRKNQARVPLPPTYHVAVVGGFSGNIQHIVGINVTREGLGSINEEFDNPVQYLPLTRALSRVKTPFPYLPLREDWPFARELVGGWSLTPFGGRGRLGEELVEFEGILGIQEPAVYTAGQTLEFSLLLWSANPLALEALAQPGAIEVGYYKSDIFSVDALNPKNSSRKNRRLARLAEGRTWVSDDGRPADDAPRPECVLVKLPEPTTPTKTPTSPLASSTAGSSRVKGAPPSRMAQVWTADADDADETTLAGDVDPSKDKDESEDRPPSPAPSFEGMDDMSDPERVIRLDGEVLVPAGSHPSFRYANMAREYLLHILIRHPQYSHISPAATGIVAEVPVWYVVDRFGHLTPGVASNEVDLASLPIKGPTIAVPEDAVRLPPSTGAVTTQKRPTNRAERMAAF